MFSNHLPYSAYLSQLYWHFSKKKLFIIHGNLYKKQLNYTPQNLYFIENDGVIFYCFNQKIAEIEFLTVKEEAFLKINILTTQRKYFLTKNLTQNEINLLNGIIYLPNEAKNIKFLKVLLSTTYQLKKRNINLDHEIKAIYRLIKFPKKLYGTENQIKLANYIQYKFVKNLALYYRTIRLEKLLTLYSLKTNINKAIFWISKRGLTRHELLENIFEKNPRKKRKLEFLNGSNEINLSRFFHLDCTMQGYGRLIIEAAKNNYREKWLHVLSKATLFNETYLFYLLKNEKLEIKNLPKALHEKILFIFDINSQDYIRKYILSPFEILELKETYQNKTIAYLVVSFRGVSITLYFNELNNIPTIQECKQALENSTYRKNGYFSFLKSRSQNIENRRKLEEQKRIKAAEAWLSILTTCEEEDINFNQIVQEQIKFLATTLSRIDEKFYYDDKERASEYYRGISNWRYATTKFHGGNIKIMLADSLTYNTRCLIDDKLYDEFEAEANLLMQH